MRLDVFKLITYQNLDLDERNVVTLLYAPLIGSEAFMLYNILWSLIDRSRLKSPEYMHTKIFDLLDCKPQEFLQARQKLEAIGLLSVFQKDDVFLYELKAPVSAEEFFKAGALGTYLYNKIGQSEFDSISKLFRIKETDKEGFVNVTATFDDVFDQVNEAVIPKDKFMSRSKSKITLKHAFDFELFLEGISKNYVDRRKITAKVNQHITTLSYMYNLDEIMMQKVFMDSVDNDKNIDLDKMSKSARYWSDVMHQSVEEPDYEEIEITFDSIKKLCMTYSPIDLIARHTGQRPSNLEKRTIEKALHEFDYPKEILNFLFLYAMSQSNNHLLPHFNFLDSIYVAMKRENVRSFEDAYNYTVNYQSKSKQSKPKKDDGAYKPDWLDDVMKEL